MVSCAGRTAPARRAHRVRAHRLRHRQRLVDRDIIAIESTHRCRAVCAQEPRDHRACPRRDVRCGWLVSGECARAGRDGEGARDDRARSRCAVRRGSRSSRHRAREDSGCRGHDRAARGAVRRPRAGAGSRTRSSTCWSRERIRPVLAVLTSSSRSRRTISPAPRTTPWDRSRRRSPARGNRGRSEAGHGRARRAAGPPRRGRPRRVPISCSVIGAMAAIGGGAERPALISHLFLITQMMIAAETGVAEGDRRRATRPRQDPRTVSCCAMWPATHVASPVS